MRTYRKLSFRKTRKTKRGGIGSSLRSSGRTSGRKSDKLERKLKRIRGSRTLKARAAANKALKLQKERIAKKKADDEYEQQRRDEEREADIAYWSEFQNR